MPDIFGYSFEDIQRAQQGGRLARRVDVSAPVSHAPTEADLELLRKYGTVAALEAAGFYGSSDKLRRAGLA